MIDANAATVMVVDGNPLLLKNLEHMFASLRELMAFRLSCHADADSALALLSGLRARERKPALIILDWDLDGGAGPAFLQRLQGDARWKGIPLIVATGKESSAQAALLKGAKDILAKPIQTKTLLAKIEKHAPAGKR